jgi:polysaccharide biosynthesis protein PelD
MALAEARNVTLSHVRIAGLRASALVESALALAGLVMLASLVGNEVRFADIAPHPFWLVVLLISVFYGSKEGLAAAAMASAFLLVDNLPDQFFGESFSSWLLRATAEPVLWFLAAILFGAKSDDFRQRIASQEEELMRAGEKVTTLAGAFEDAQQANSVLERELSASSRTISTVYDASRSLAKDDDAAFLASIPDFLRKLLGSGDFAVYLEDAGMLRPVADDADAGRTAIDPEDALFRVVFEQRQFLRIASPVDQLILDGRGVMAGPLVCERSDAVGGIVIARDIAARHLAPSTYYDFQLACAWLGMVLQERRTRRFDPYSAERMDQTLRVLSSLAEIQQFPLTALFVTVSGALGEEGDAGFDRTAFFCGIASAVLADRQPWFVYPDDGWDFLILLPGESVSSGRRLAERLKIALLQSSGCSDFGAVRYELEALVDVPHRLKVIANDR